MGRKETHAPEVASAASGVGDSAQGQAAIHRPCGACLS